MVLAMVGLLIYMLVQYHTRNKDKEIKGKLWKGLFFVAGKMHSVIPEKTDAMLPLYMFIFKPIFSWCLFHMICKWKNRSLYSSVLFFMRLLYDIFFILNPVLVMFDNSI